MHQKDTVGYWRIHCKEARRKVATLEIQNKAMREALAELIEIIRPCTVDGDFGDIDSFTLQPADKALAKAKGESE